VAVGTITNGEVREHLDAADGFLTTPLILTHESAKGGRNAVHARPNTSNFEPLTGSGQALNFEELLLAAELAAHFAQQAEINDSLDGYLAEIFLCPANEIEMDI